MKANPISSGFVNLRLCLHCGAFSRFLHPLVLLLHLKTLFLHVSVMRTQHVESQEVLHDRRM